MAPSTLPSRRLRVWGATCAIALAAAVLSPLAPAFTAAADADTVDEISSNYGDDAGTSIWLHWRGAENAVSYGTDSTYGTDVVGQPTWVTPVDAPGPFWRVELTGLTPGTVYHYRIGATGADHQVETAPNGDFTWDDIGDTGSSYWAPGGTAECNKSWMPSFWQQLAADQADVYTHGGDISYANACGNPASHQLFDDIAPVSTTRVIEWSQGNHEYGSPTANAPPGTVRDVLNNYKGRYVMAHGQTVTNDSATQTSHPGCAAVGVTGNACRGQDWGWFDVGHVRFISRPEPEVNAYADWTTRADAIMAAAQADPDIDMVVTYGHRPACSSLRNSTGFANDPKVAPAVATLGDRYSPAARPDGKYVLDVGHHVHLAEVCGPVHGVMELTDGTGGSEQATTTATNPASLWKTNHFAYLRARVTGKTMSLEYVCGPLDTAAPTKAPACTQGAVVYSLTVAPGSGQPPAVTQYVVNTSLETDLTGWTGQSTGASRITRVNGGYDGAWSLRVGNGGTTSATVGVVDKPHWMTSTVASRQYTASAFVSPEVVGQKVTLLLRELTSTGALVTTKSVTVTTTSTGWLPVTLTYVAAGSGNQLGFYVNGPGVAPGSGFRVDQLGLTALTPGP